MKTTMKNSRWNQDLNEPGKERSKIGRNIEVYGPSKAGAEENRRQEMNLPPLLAAHLGRNEDGQPSRSSLTFVHRGHQFSINTGGNLLTGGLKGWYYDNGFIKLGDVVLIDIGGVIKAEFVLCAGSMRIVNKDWGWEPVDMDAQRMVGVGERR
ncbi:hypothetical protein Tco_0714632 [Tanacetum coccineum]